MSPDGIDCRPGLDIDDLVGWRGRVGTTIAGDIIGRHVRNRTVVSRSPDTIRNGICDAAGIKLKEDRVRGCQTGTGDANC